MNEWDHLVYESVQTFFLLWFATKNRKQKDKYHVGYLWASLIYFAPLANAPRWQVGLEILEKGPQTIYNICERGRSLVKGIKMLL